MVKIAALVVPTRWVVKMKERQPFCGEFSILSIEIRTVVEHVV